MIDHPLSEDHWMHQQFGAVLERLRAMEHLIGEQNKKFDAVFSKVDSHHDQLTEIRAKAGVMSAVIAVVFSAAGWLTTWLWPSHK